LLLATINPYSGVVEEPRLVAVGEIAALLGITVQRVDVLSRQKNFPDPAHVLSAGRIWRYSDIEAWATATGRTLKPGADVSSNDKAAKPKPAARGTAKSRRPK
jgi:predicted DNA-binding transcriptional regulator AlpA